MAFKLIIGEATETPWNPLAQPTNKVDFAGHVTPGIAEVVGASSPRRWDERESYGWSGAFIVYHGVNLSHFSVKIRLITRQDWADWYAFKPIVDRVPLGTLQRPVDISHPYLDLLGIHSVVVDDVTQPDQVEHGIFEIEIKLIEYRSPRMALAAARGSQATPDDPEDQRVADITAMKESAAQEVERLERGTRGGP